MITGKKNIEAWFGSTKKPYWFLYEYNKIDSGKRKGSSSDIEGATHADAAAELAQALNRIGYGKYSLVATDKPGNLPTRGFLHEDFEISAFESNGTPNMPTVSGIPDGYMSKESVQELIQKEIQRHKAETELEALRKENTQLKKDLRVAEQQDGLSRLAGIAADLYPHFKDRLVPAAVAGIPPELHPKNNPMPTDQIEVMEVTPEQQERLSIAVGAFAEAAPDEWLEILEKMAAKVRTNPAIINTLKAFL